MPGQAGAKLERLRQRSRLVDALWQMVTKAKTDGERRLAAEITYYAFFSLFPLLMVFVTIVQAAFDQRRSEEILDSALGQFPVIGNDLVRNVSSPEGRGRGGVDRHRARPVGRFARLRVVRARDASCGRGRPCRRRAW